MTLSCFDRALSLACDDNMADVWYNIGQIAIGIGDLGLAYQAFKVAVSVDNNHAEAYNNLGVGECAMTIVLIWDRCSNIERVIRIQLVQISKHVHRWRTICFNRSIIWVYWRTSLVRMKRVIARLNKLYYYTPITAIQKTCAKNCVIFSPDTNKSMFIQQMCVDVYKK